MQLYIIEAFIKENSMNIICLSNIYSILNANHPSSTKRGGVCIYFKEYLPRTETIDIFKLNEYILTEINVNNER